MKELGFSLRSVLQTVGLSTSTWHYRHTPRARVAAPVAQSDRAYRSRLSSAEQEKILALLTEGFEAGQSVYECWMQALDGGDPIASQASWYRLARTLEAQRPVRPRKRRRAAAMPQFSATAPNEVWCWDITKLPGTYVGQSYCLYSVIDAFSRKIVGWAVHDREDQNLARDMFTAAIAAEGGACPEKVHSDRGAAMVSEVLKEFYRDMEIDPSWNRPRVSNDNPFAESSFRTLKHANGGMPPFFNTLEEAREWAARKIQHYNEKRAHSSLEGHTPNSVHDGTWVQVHNRRQAALDALAARHPERYAKKPELKTPYAAVTLNTKRPPERLQTA